MVFAQYILYFTVKQFHDINKFMISRPFNALVPASVSFVTSRTRWRTLETLIQDDSIQ